MHRADPARTLLAILCVMLFSNPVAAAVITVRAGDNLQAALDAAQPGDVIELQAGATFRGNFVLGVKAGSEYVTVRTAAGSGTLPSAGTRISPADAPWLAKIQSPNGLPAIRTAAGAHHWRLQLVEFPPTHLGAGEIIRLGDGSVAQSSVDLVPFDLEVDRVYVHGDPYYGQKRGISLNAARVTIRGSYISGIKAIGVDTQAIGGWNGPGPFLIENNYLEAAGENVMFGGSDPAIPNLVSADIVVRHNYMSKPLSWRAPLLQTPVFARHDVTPGAGSVAAGTYAYRVVARRPATEGAMARSAASGAVTIDVPAGTDASVTLSWTAVPDATEYRVYRSGMDNQYWTVTGTNFTDTGASGSPGVAPVAAGDAWLVKNIFELKNARRVLVEYNVFENNWAHGQPGYAILFTPRNQDGACPWCVVEDVTFQFNIVRHSAAGINLLGYDWPNTSAQTTGVRIRHNLFYDITPSLGGSGWFLLMGNGPRDVVVDHNTVDATGTAVLYVYGGTSSAPTTVAGFRFTNNAARHNTYGLNGEHFSWGGGVINSYFPGSLVSGNWLEGGTAGRYPAGNQFSGPFGTAFLNAAAGDYRPAAGGILTQGSTDGLPVGADITGLLAGLKGVVEGAQRPRTPTGVRLVR